MAMCRVWAEPKQRGEGCGPALGSGSDYFANQTFEFRTSKTPRAG